MSQPASSVPIEIDVLRVKYMLDDKQDVLLLDIREEKEREAAKIEGTMFIPMAEVQQRVGELEEYKDRPLVVHCHRGGRSLRVTQWLRTQGFTKVQNMTGGIDAWSLMVDNRVPQY